MRRFSPLLSILAVTVFVSAALAEKPARTDVLPAALADLNVGTNLLLTETEARNIRGQALDVSRVLAASQAIELWALTVNGSAVSSAGQAVSQSGQVLELPGGVSFFGDTFFDEGLLINLTSGRGAIFNPGNARAGVVFLSDLTGSFTVQRDARGFVLFIAN